MTQVVPMWRWAPTASSLCPAIPTWRPLRGASRVWSHSPKPDRPWTRRGVSALQDVSGWAWQGLVGRLVDSCDECDGWLRSRVLTHVMSQVMSVMRCDESSGECDESSGEQYGKGRVILNNVRE